MGGQANRFQQNRFSSGVRPAQQQNTLIGREADRIGHGLFTAEDKQWMLYIGQKDTFRREFETLAADQRALLRFGQHHVGLLEGDLGRMKALGLARQVMG